MNSLPASAHGRRICLLEFEANFSFFSSAESPPRDLPTNNGLLMRNAVQPVFGSVWLQIRLGANNILHMRKGNLAFLLLAIALT